MNEVDRILDGFTDPTTGSLHGAIFIVIDRSGKLIKVNSEFMPSVAPTLLLSLQNFIVFKSSSDQCIGNTIYERTSGKASFDKINSDPPQLNSLCWVASMSKLITSIAVMQLVERNLLSLEDDALLNNTLEEASDEVATLHGSCTVGGIL